MTDDRLDLSALGSASSLDDLVRSIDARCAPLLAERRERPMSVMIAGWWRPTLAAALMIMALSVAVLARESHRRERDALTLAETTSSLARSVGVPAPLAGRLTGELPPTMLDLLSEAGR